MADVGFIGLGTMGAPMARNLIAAGHKLSFFARRSDVVDQFRAAGATPCSSCAEVAELSDIVITIVPTDREVQEVVLGTDGIAAAAKRDLLLIDMSTISPRTIRDIAASPQASGISVLDAPVSGGPSGAKNGTLTIMVGGDAADLDGARDVLGAMGERIFHVGPIGAGQTVKLINQLMAGGIMTLIGEGLAIARSAGLDLDQVADVVSVSSGNSSVFSARNRFVIEDRFEPGFTTILMRKDVSLAIELAEQFGVSTPVASQALEQYDGALARGCGDEDFASVASRTYER